MQVFLSNSFIASQIANNAFMSWAAEQKCNRVFIEKIPFSALTNTAL